MTDPVQSTAIVVQVLRPCSHHSHRPGRQLQPRRRLEAHRIVRSPDARGLRGGAPGRTPTLDMDRMNEGHQAGARQSQKMERRRFGFYYFAAGRRFASP